MPVQTRSMVRAENNDPDPIKDNYVSNIEFNKEEFINLMNNTPTFLLGNICIFPTVLVLVLAGVYYLI